MKKYMDIQNIKDTETELSPVNIGAFEVGDDVQITEKLDGSNASFTVDDNGVLVCFSRNKELDARNNLDGFWNYVQTLTASEYAPERGLIYFGEYLRKNAITYHTENMNKFYLFDIYDSINGKWMPKDFVWAKATEHGLLTVPVLYRGEFISWEHCRSFMNSPSLGDTQEGIVVVNQSKINHPLGSGTPVYLKIVNKAFKETKSRSKKVVSPEEMQERDRVAELVKTIVTERRVQKMLFKLRDDGEIPEEILPTDMKLIATVLPKRIYEDCVKEEPKTVEACGKTAGKVIFSETMKVARAIIFGDA